MHGGTLIILLLSVGDAGAQYLASMGSQKSGITYRPPMRTNPSLTSYSAGQNSPTVQQQSQYLNLPAAIASVPRAVWTEAISGQDAAVIRADAGAQNVFGEAMRACETKTSGIGNEEQVGKRKFKAVPGIKKDTCSYTSDSPSVCVSLVGRDYDPATDDSGDKLNEQCMSVWNLGMDPFMKDLWYGRANFFVQCDAVSMEALASQYSSDSASDAAAAQYRRYKWTDWKNIGRKFFRKGDPFDQEVTTGDRSFWLGGGGPSKNQRFRASLEVICNQCSSRAPSEGAKETLRSQCSALNLAASELPGTDFEYGVPMLLTCALASSFTLALLTVRKIRNSHKPSEGEQYQPLAHA